MKRVLKLVISFVVLLLEYEPDLLSMHNPYLVLERNQTRLTRTLKT
jgi:hypothetical protein